MSRPPMQLSNRGFELLKKYEEFKDKAYKDRKGVWTIGYGHTRNVKPGMTIDEPSASQLLNTESKRFDDRINKYVKVPLNQNQHDALVLFDYNTGGLASSTLLKKLNTGDYKGAFNDELPRWNKVKDEKTKKYVVSPGLINRRKYEQDLANEPMPLMLKPEYLNLPKQPQQQDEQEQGQ